MEVLLQIVQPDSSAWRDGSSDLLTHREESRRSLSSRSRAARHTDLESSHTACKANARSIGCLRLLHKPQPCKGDQTCTSGCGCWCVSLLRAEGGDERTDAVHGAVRSSTDAQSPSAEVARAPAEATFASAVAAATAASERAVSLPRVRLHASHVVLCTPTGQRRPLPLAPCAKDNSASLHAVLCHKLHQLLTRVEAPGNVADRKAADLLSTILFCGSSVRTRKDALFLTSLHRLLVECLLHEQRKVCGLTGEKQLRVDVSLVTCYELWGIGDVLAREGGMLTSQESVTWHRLLSLIPQLDRPHATEQGDAPSAAAVSELVHGQLREWSARIDSAAAAWSRTCSTAAPLTAADKLAYLESNVVICTLRFRASDARSSRRTREDEGAAHFSLVLLPDSNPSSSTHRASAVLWREFEALSRFMQSFPSPGSASTRHEHLTHLTSSFAAATSATLHAAALRRSRWLTALARLQTSRSGDGALQWFTRELPPQSFAWVGCVSADWADSRATRSTLALLGRLNAHPPHALRLYHSTTQTGSARPPQPAALSDEADRDPAGRSLSASSSSSTHSNTVHSPRPSTQAPQPYQRSALGKRDLVSEPPNLQRDPEKGRFELSSAADLSTAAPQRILPSAATDDGGCAANVASVGAASEGGTRRNATSNVGAAQHAVLPTSPTPPSPSTSDLAALVTSLQLYTSTLEAEVRRLRARLTRYEKNECGELSRSSGAAPASPLDEQQRQRVQRAQDGALSLLLPHAAGVVVADEPPSLPPSVEAAAVDLSADPGFPSALQPKLNALLQCVAKARRVERPDAALHDTRCKYTEQLELKVALYEQRLALVDHYVTPTLTRCADEIDHCLQPRVKAHSGKQ